MGIVDCGSRSAECGVRNEEILDCRLINERFQVSGVRKEKQERHDALYPNY